MAYIYNFLNTMIVKHVLLYGLHQLMMCAIHLCIISIIAFFHFMQSHKLGIVEEWIFYRGWEIIFITKVMALLATIRLLLPNGWEKGVVIKKLSEGIIYPTKEILVVIIFVFFYIMLLGEPERSFNKNFEIGRTIISFGSVFVFYLADILVLYLFVPEQKGKSKGIFLYLFVLTPTIFYITGKTAFLYEQNINYIMVFNYLFCVYLSTWRKRNWSLPATYLALFVCPISVFFGLDPIWGNSFSYLTMSCKLAWYHFFVLTFISILYLSFKGSRQGRRGLFRRNFFRQLFSGNK